MSAQLNLKEIERKAFRSTYQDGLWDVYVGLVVVALAIFMYRPETGYSGLNIGLAVAGMALAYFIFWAGKKLFTVPRMGQVKFGALRRQRKRTLAMILGVVIFIQAGIVGFTVLAWVNPAVGAQVNGFLKGRGLMDLAVAAIGAMFVGPSMLLIAYFNDFPRGYYIAIMMALAVFLMIWLNQPVYPVIIGGMITLPGVALFVRFLQQYPLRQTDTPHE